MQDGDSHHLLFLIKGGWRKVSPMAIFPKVYLLLFVPPNKHTIGR